MFVLFLFLQKIYPTQTIKNYKQIKIFKCKVSLVTGFLKLV